MQARQENSSETTALTKQEQDPKLAPWGKMARWMDTAFRVPGTKIRFGLDPLLGLVPGVGDLIAGAISSTLLWQAAHMGVPKIVQFRMALNIMINALLGVLPGIGDLFSVWFKSNLRNYELMQKHLATSQDKQPGTASSWAFVVLLIGGGLLLVVGTIYGLASLVALAFRG